MIKERVSGGHGVTVCGRQTDTPADTSTPHGDEQPVYLSDSNSVEIRVVSARSKKDGRQFLLRYHGQCVCVCVCVCVCSSTVQWIADFAPADWCVWWCYHLANSA